MRRISLRLTSSRRAAGALATLALALPASAAAAPSVYSVDAKTGDAGVTFLTDPTGASLTSTQRQYVVAGDGYAVGFKETNGVSGDGVLNYAVLPSDYRAPMTAEQKRTYAAAQTDVQPHATCSGVAALSSGANILAWQSASADPVYDYIPWQKTSAGLGDDPAKWIAVVKTATGVDLSTLASTAAFTTACTNLGGTYHAADASSAVATLLIADAVAPLQKQITTLTAAKATSDKAAATATDARKLAEAAYQALFTRPIDLTLAAKRFAPQSGVALITGSATDPVHVTLEVSKKQKKALGISSRVLAEFDSEISSEGAALITLKPEKSVLKRLAKHKKPIPVTVLAVSGGSQDSATATLTR